MILGIRKEQGGRFLVLTQIRTSIGVSIYSGMCKLWKDSSSSYFSEGTVEIRQFDLNGLSESIKSTTCVQSFEKRSQHTVEYRYFSVNFSTIFVKASSTTPVQSLKKRDQQHSGANCFVRASPYYYDKWDNKGPLFY